MARNNNKLTRRKKVQPSPLTLSFSVTVPRMVDGTPGTLTQYLDISQVTSLLSRRFYRQGINWPVAGFKFLLQPSLVAGSLNGSIVITKLPVTWVMSNAWEKGMRTWMKMNRDALAESPSVKPKFLDFKIYADAGHHAVGFDANLLPINTTSTAAAGEWESSKFVIPKTDGTDDVNSREVIATGPSYPGASPVTTLNAVSLIEGYAASRGLPDIEDPNTPTDAQDASGTAPENWMSALFNDGTEQDGVVLTDMVSENNQAPYPFENGQIPGAAPGTVWGDTQYPGGANQLPGLQIHDIEYVTGTTVGGTSYLKGGQFPCGLIRFDFVNNDENADLVHTFTIDLVPGDHRGYLCEPMTEM